MSKRVNNFKGKKLRAEGCCIGIPFANRKGKIVAPESSLKKIVKKLIG